MIRINAAVILCFICLYLVIESIPNETLYRGVKQNIEEIEYENKIPIEAILFIYVLPFLVSLSNIWKTDVYIFRNKIAFLLLTSSAILIVYTSCFIISALFLSEHYNIFRHPRGAPYPFYLIASLFFNSIFTLLGIYIKNNRSSQS